MLPESHALHPVSASLSLTHSLSLSLSLSLPLSLSLTLSLSLLSSLLSLHSLLSYLLPSLSSLLPSTVPSLSHLSPLSLLSCLSGPSVWNMLEPCSSPGTDETANSQVLVPQLEHIYSRQCSRRKQVWAGGKKKKKSCEIFPLALTDFGFFFNLTIGRASCRESG